ncbi:TVG0132669 [Thermoplasma volcanium GSS1]|uniref:TVG0132669 protein n=1 Tax=Thermoplasma volcanium (strain ATCC 51530 / DSM 4299 / JCM 9571 / NBRC 15438 / GSS1) TaxID=273116 RepID=Q97CH6_THEVO|nr:TVG0132669 [Thermoplasma volcanium GSS1]
MSISLVAKFRIICTDGEKLLILAENIIIQFLNFTTQSKKYLECGDLGVKND